MSNNIVELHGYLVIKDIARSATPDQILNAALDGWIFTGPSAAGGRHPFFATGKPADVILENYAEFPFSSNPECPRFPTLGVTVRGKLMTGPTRSLLELKHLSVFDISASLGDPDVFITNSVKLQGYLNLSPAATVVWIGEIAVPVLDTILATDKATAGGAHPVLLSDELAGKLAQSFHRLGTGPLPATVSGRLVTVGDRSSVHADLLSLGKKVG